MSNAPRPEETKGLLSIIKKFNNSVDEQIGKIWNSVEPRMSAMYGRLLGAPVVTLVLMLLITAWFASEGMSFQDQIEDDVEVFLPEGADSTDLLLEVREEWSTDISVIYITTPNIKFPCENDCFEPENDENNVSNVNILREISWIEGDDENANSGFLSSGIDPIKDDRGREDGVLWVISISQVIKEINSSDGRFNLAMCQHGINDRFGNALPCSDLSSTIGGGGAYSIPDQDRINQIIEESEGGFDGLAKDTNGDGVWDTTFVLVGMNNDLSSTPWSDFDGLLAHFGEILDIDNRPEGSQTTSMTLTGLTKVLADVSDAIYHDLLNILPISLLLTVLVISLLHRSWKVVIITGTPILMALATTFGFSVILDMSLTPMIIATFPILIGLGVDYALHMVNRIEEVRRKRLDLQREENERLRRAGELVEDETELWDINFYKGCVVEMTKTTGVAVLLSAITTMIGFSVLIAPMIVPVVPIRSVGLTLVVGIFSTLVFSILLVPVLAWLLKYHKRTNPGAWRNIGRYPVKNFLVILLITGGITAYGISEMGQMDKPITGSSETPEGIESLEALATYSEQFGSGQISMFVFDASERGPQNDTYAIRDLPVLESMEALEQKISGVDNTTTTSIITFLKAIPATVEAGGFVLHEGSLWDLLQNECWESNNPECLHWVALDATETDGKGREEIRKDMVNVVFDTLSPEVRSMLTNSANEKALVLVEQPYLNLNRAGELRDEIDEMLLEENSEQGIRTSKLTGGLPVSLDINKGIHDTQNLTTLLTMIILTLVLAVMFRSLRLGIYTMIPVAVVILWQPLMMASDDVNVNIFTAMIGTIVFGIGVDDAIHVMHRIREEGESAVGLARSVETTGQTIFETSLTTIAGLSAGFFVAFPGLENFFMIMIALIAFAFLTSTFLLPSIIAAEHMASSKIRKKDEWMDFGEGISIASDMEAIDAIIE